MENGKLPTEQDVLRALAYWQGSSQRCIPGQACAPGKCFCCDMVRSLSGNAPLIAMVQNITMQLKAGTVSEADALLSVYVFGLLTADVMEQEAAKKQNRRAVL